METRGSRELRKIVIDANLAINVVLRGHPYHHQAQRFFADCAQTGRLLLAPPLYESESDSVIRRFVHLSILTKEEGVAAQAVLNALPIIIVYDPKVRARARQVAEEFKQPRVYDATYAALAELQGCEFCTADETFYNTVKESLTFVKFLGS